MTRPLRNTMITARYQPFAHGWEAAGFTYMPFRWQKEHRFVAVRRAAALEPESIQQRLFTFKQYTYHQALVTNLEPTAAAVWRFYCDRGFQELLLREFKELLYDGQDSHPQLLGQCRLHGDGSVVLRPGPGVPILVLARRSTQLEHCNPATRALVVACGVGQTDNRNVLVLPAKYPRQDLFLKIQQASEKIRPIV
jgi:hypothetical protein